MKVTSRSGARLIDGYEGILIGQKRRRTRLSQPPQDTILRSQGDQKEMRDDLREQARMRPC